MSKWSRRIDFGSHPNQIRQITDYSEIFVGKLPNLDFGPNLDFKLKHILYHRICNQDG